MEYTLDWNKVRYEVDIEQYFLFKLGHLYQFDRYKKAYVTEQHGDIIRFFNHGKSGVKMYYSITFQDSGDIIQLIKKRILRNENASAIEINQEIFDFSEDMRSGNMKLQQSYFKEFSPKTALNQNSYILYGDIIQNIELHKSYLQNYRKLAPETLYSKIFNNIFYSYKTQNIESLAFDIRDIQKNRVGVVRIQTEQNEYFNKKWFDKNSKNGIGFTFSNFEDNTETLSIFESIFDAISFHELNNLENVQYCSTNGELSFNKAKLIQEYFQKNHFKKLMLGNDNDLAGHYFNLNIICSFISLTESVRKSQNNICVEMISNIDDTKTKVLSNFFKNSNSKFELEDKSELPQSYFTETISKNETKYYYLIANTIDSIQFFVGLLFRSWNLEEFITICLPKNKDFNEDLIQLKTTNHG